jgi:hypothetical protein
MELSVDGRKRRVMDTSNRDARRALAGTIAKFILWREDIAAFKILSARASSDGEREAILSRCSAIEHEVLDARVEILSALAEAPRGVAGHSRVVDVERALDNVDSELVAIRTQLSPATSH